ncbi:MAG: ADP-dependent glucokinase/phosphofructokinase, partial [Candidatus Heimdallarchaeaceae archaeon]
MGFNVNIDKIIEITPESIDWKLPDGFDLKLKNSLLRLPSRVNSIEDFFLYLMDSMMNGKAVEVGVTSEEIADWIENSFEIENVQIGGQAGIIANLFKSIEVGNVL